MLLVTDLLPGYRLGSQLRRWSGTFFDGSVPRVGCKHMCLTKHWSSQLWCSIDSCVYCTDGHSGGKEEERKLVDEQPRIAAVYQVLQWKLVLRTDAKVYWA